MCANADPAAILAGTSAGAPPIEEVGAPASSPASGEPDADTTTVIEDGGNGATTTPATEEEAAGARGDMGDTQAPAVSAQEEDVGVDEGAEAAIDTAVPAEPSPATEVVSPPSTDPANDDQPAEDLPATGTE